MSRPQLVVAVVLSLVALLALMIGAAVYGMAAGHCEDDR